MLQYFPNSRIYLGIPDSIGCNRLSTIVAKLPVHPDIAKLLINLLLRLDRKLQNGVDDSNGIVGGFMNEVVAVLEDFVKLDPLCIPAFAKLIGAHTCFGWEDPLVRILDEGV